MTNWKDEVLKHYPDAVVEDTSEKGYKQAYFNEVIKSRKNITSQFVNGEIVNALDYIAHVKMEAEMLYAQNNLSNHDKEYLWDLTCKIREFSNRDNKL